MPVSAALTSFSSQVPAGPTTAGQSPGGSAQTRRIGSNPTPQESLMEHGQQFFSALQAISTVHAAQGGEFPSQLRQLAQASASLSAILQRNGVNALTSVRGEGPISSGADDWNAVRAAYVAAKNSGPEQAPLHLALLARAVTAYTRRLESVTQDFRLMRHVQFQTQAQASAASRPRIQASATAQALRARFVQGSSAPTGAPPAYSPAAQETIDKLFGKLQAAQNGEPNAQSVPAVLAEIGSALANCSQEDTATRDALVSALAAAFDQLPEAADKSNALNIMTIYLSGASWKDLQKHDASLATRYPASLKNATGPQQILSDAVRAEVLIKMMQSAQLDDAARHRLKWAVIRNLEPMAKRSPTPFTKLAGFVTTAPVQPGNASPQFNVTDDRMKEAMISAVTAYTPGTHDIGDDHETLKTILDVICDIGKLVGESRRSDAWPLLGRVWSDKLLGVIQHQLSKPSQTPGAALVLLEAVAFIPDHLQISDFMGSQRKRFRSLTSGYRQEAVLSKILLDIYQKLHAWRGDMTTCRRVVASCKRLENLLTATGSREMSVKGLPARLFELPAYQAKIEYANREERPTPEMVFSENATQLTFCQVMREQVTSWIRLNTP